MNSPGQPARIASIDGLRAIAILLVVVSHYVPWAVTDKGPASAVVREISGWASSGVDLFFVLSGFLITGILVDSKDSPNYFTRFYWRRSLRIFPAYYAYLLPLLFMPGFFQTISRPWFVFYLRNWRGTDDASDGMLGHLWSLAVEEQFYIGWAIVVFLVAARWLPYVSVALIVLAPLVRIAMGHYGYTGYEIFRVTPARMDSLLLGALVALAVRSSWKSKLPHAAWIGMAVSAAGLIVVRALTGPLNRDLGITQVILPFCLPLLYASVLAWCLEARYGQFIHTSLTNPVFRIIAKYSYAIYLFHLLVGRVLVLMSRSLSARFPDLNVVVKILYIPVALTTLFGLAALSWRCIESPALKLKDRFFGAPAKMNPLPAAISAERLA